MMRREEVFDEYYETFKKLDKEDKIKFIIEQYKETLGFLSNLNKELKQDSRILINKEMFDVEVSKDNYEDFINSSFIYINSIKESLGIYTDFVSNLIYKEDNKEG